jgi:hypothetical protein
VRPCPRPRPRRRTQRWRRSAEHIVAASLIPWRVETHSLIG